MAIMRRVPEIGALILHDIQMQIIEEDRITGELNCRFLFARMPVRRL